MAASLFIGCSWFGGEKGLPDDRDGFIHRVLLAEDARAIDDPILSHALLHEDPVVRRYAYRALGRIGDVRGLGVLFKTANAETVPGLRAEAVYAMGLHRHPSMVDMSERFILDENPSVRAALMRALGASGDDRALMALLDGLEDPEPLVRGEAALGVGRLAREQGEALKGRSFAAFSRLAYRVLQEPLPDVRWRMAYAASVLKRDELRATLVEATRDPEARVRAMACSGLSDLKVTETSARALVDALDDPKWFVAVEAAKALKEAPHGIALEAPVAVEPEQPTPVVVESEALATPSTPSTPVTELPAGVTVADASPGEPPVPDGPSVDPSAGALAAVAVSPGGPRPDVLGDRVLTGLVRALGDATTDGHPSHHVRAAAATSLGEFVLRSDSTILNEAYATVLPVLRKALSDPSPSVAAAALSSFAPIAIAVQPDGAEVRAVCIGLMERQGDLVGRFLRARVAEVAADLPGGAGLPLIRSLLEDRAPAVRAAAIAALPRFSSSVEEAENLIAEALDERDVALRDAAAIAAGELGRPTLGEELRAALLDSDGADYVEPRISMLKALAIVLSDEALPTLRESLRDPEAAVRDAARLEIARLGGELPSLPRVSPPERVAHPRPGRDLLLAENPRATLFTNLGPFVLELLADEAPVHSTAFLERCRSGFYDGLAFHRLVPGFVVQGLDPRGDGYGGGGRTLRGEVNAMRFGNGIVGMPDAGPDTGGCQIFVTFRPQPRLDDRYTVFARVVEGMDVVERLDVGDQVDYVVLDAEP